MARIVTISGSPSPSSRTKAVVEYIIGLPAAKGWQKDSIEVRELPPEDLVYARFDSPAVQNTARLLEKAEGVIIATPVYKASYAGLLKAYLDLLPQDVLAGKVVWPIAVGGTLAHLLVIDYALKPVLYALGAQNVLSGVYIQDRWIRRYQERILLESEAEERIRTSLERFVRNLTPSNQRE
ncbi:MAG: NADPH-dependent FMN reductase [Planifilum fimeticola]